jgi:predicted kinase
MRLIRLSPRSLVALIGCSGAGKTTFATRHFKKYQVLSSDVFRGLVADDEGDQDATPDAFDALYFVASRRLARGLLTVIDATNVNAFARARVAECARTQRVQCIALVLNLPLDLCIERAARRTVRPVPDSVIRDQHTSISAAIAALSGEGFDQVHLINSTLELNATAIVIGGDDLGG